MLAPMNFPDLYQFIVTTRMLIMITSIRLMLEKLERLPLVLPEITTINMKESLVLLILRTTMWFQSIDITMKHIMITSILLMLEKLELLTPDRLETTDINLRELLSISLLITITDWFLFIDIGTPETIITSIRPMRQKLELLQLDNPVTTVIPAKEF